jgi:hypothetical protein
LPFAGIFRVEYSALKGSFRRTSGWADAGSSERLLKRQQNAIEFKMIFMKSSTLTRRKKPRKLLTQV